MRPSRLLLATLTSLALASAACGPNDEMITDRVNYALATQSIEWAQFTVQDRHVTLTGLAPTSEAQARIGPLITAIQGVRGVTDQTGVDTVFVRRVAEASACRTAVEGALESGRIDFQGARIQRASNRVLDAIATALAGCPDAAVNIAAHTDSQGADDANMRLTEQRAQAVVAYLTGKGLAAGRFTAVGHGETQPIADNSTASGRAQNRRVEITVAAPEFRPSGG